VAGGSYTGTTGSDQAGGGSRVNFQVSANVKKLTSIRFEPPIEFIGGCVSPNLIPSVTGRNVPIHGGTFVFKVASGKITHGDGTTDTDTITGRFLSGRKAAGTVVSMINEGNQIHCSGSNTWTASVTRS
jgi:hypothetical protein